VITIDEDGKGKVTPQVRLLLFPFTERIGLAPIRLWPRSAPVFALGRIVLGHRFMSTPSLASYGQGPSMSALAQQLKLRNKSLSSLAQYQVVSPMVF
jgi:hypothetical protein